MNAPKIIPIMLLFTFLWSCNENVETPKDAMAEKIEAEIDLQEYEQDFLKWWTYHTNNISLSSNFIGLNEQSDTLNKGDFLAELLSANFVPLKIKSKEKFDTYQLFSLDIDADKSIRSAIRNEAKLNLHHFEMEGKHLPEFTFTNLNEERFTPENTKGKTLILKTWFIACQACVAEFPELNELVEKYHQREDLLFVSLATNEQSKLEKFLQKKDFAYHVIPQQGEYIKEKLGLYNYPTHLIVNQNGEILKVVNKAEEMIEFLENELETS